MNPTIIYKNVKHANIKIKPTKEVTLTVPYGLSIKAIEEILRAKAKWIQKHLNSFVATKKPRKKPPSKRLVEGGNFRYLGKIYKLKIVQEAEGGGEYAKLSKGCFTLCVVNKSDHTKKEQLVHDWYRTKAKEHFARIIDKYSPIVGIPIQAVRIKTMTTRWGSCNTKKAYINLNLELIKQPKEAIEYVVFHELTHLIHPNHSKHFYGYIAQYMSDWEERRDKLRIE